MSRTQNNLETDIETSKQVTSTLTRMRDRHLILHAIADWSPDCGHQSITRLRDELSAIPCTVDEASALDWLDREGLIECWECQRDVMLVVDSTIDEDLVSAANEYTSYYP